LLCHHWNNINQSIMRAIKESAGHLTGKKMLQWLDKKIYWILSIYGHLKLLVPSTGIKWAPWGEIAHS
jgi:hypothetical protein